MSDAEQYWKTLRTAQHSLISTIASQLSNPSFTQLQHLSSYIPADRPTARASIQALDSQISSIITQFEEIEAAHQELTGLYRQCKAIESTLAACLSPIGSLPVELIQYIVDFIVESPRHARQIATFSHVNRAWRNAVLGMPELFTSPDWLYWPSDFRAEWIARAGESNLDAYLMETRTTPEAAYRLQIGLAALVPLAARLSALRVHICESKTLPPELLTLLQQPMPNVETIIVVGGLRHSVPIALSGMPCLRTLHSTRFNFVEADPETKGDPGTKRNTGVRTLQSLGSLVTHSSQLEDLLDIVEALKDDFHLTIYANTGTGLTESLLKSWRVRQNAWDQLSSLRLHGFHDEDERRFAALVKRFTAPQLHSLELFETSSRVFDVLVAEMPTETLSQVKTLLIAGFEKWERSLRRHIEALTINPNSNTKSPFPNLANLVFQDLPSKESCIPRVDAKQLARCMASRRGILKRLIIPSNLDPRNTSELPLEIGDLGQSGDDFSRFSTPYSSYPTVALTLDEEHTIKVAGDLEEIGYTYLTSHHGFDLPLPYYLGGSIDDDFSD